MSPGRGRSRTSASRYGRGRFSGSADWSARGARSWPTCCSAPTRRTGAGCTRTARAIANGISMIAENRQEDGLFLIRPVKENMVVLHTEKAGPLVGRKKENALVRGMVKRFGIVASPSQEARELSGGNQQKVIMSRWLLSEARVFIFDEPTKGIDIGAKQEIYRFMTDLAGRGKLIITYSSDMQELFSMSDRI